MSRQVDKKFIDLDKKFTKVLELIELKQVDFALEAKINPGTLSKALERSSFSDDIVDKIYKTFGVRQGYWEDGKDPILTGNGTYVKTRSKQKDPDEIRILRLMIERMGETNAYLLKRITELGG
jgi:hypothetical protein